MPVDVGQAQEVVQACLQGSMLLTDEEQAFVVSLALQLDETGKIADPQVQRLGVIYHALCSRQYL